MGSRAYTIASAHQLRAGTTITIGNTAHTCAALFTCSALPGAGAYQTLVALQSGTAARELQLHLNGDTGPGTLALKVGSTRVVPSTSMIPSTDGRWYLGVATKATGTVAVNFALLDIAAQTWTEFASSGTVANLTSNTASPNIGSRGTSVDLWAGRIAAGIILPVQLSQAQYKCLARGRRVWREYFSRYVGRQGVAPAGMLADLTWLPNALSFQAGALGNLFDLGMGRLWNGTDPVFDPSTPPNW